MIRYFDKSEWNIEPEDQPFLWKRYGLNVIMDGYDTVTGTRLHVVEDSEKYDYYKELARKTGMKHVILDNALVVSESYFKKYFLGER